jgi:hypothetical protein
VVGVALFVVTITRAVAPGHTRRAVSVMANMPSTVRFYEQLLLTEWAEATPPEYPGLTDQLPEHRRTACLRCCKATQADHVSVTDRRIGRGLLRHRDFRHVCAANAISKFWPFNGDVARPPAGTVDDSCRGYADRLLSDRTTLRDA